MLQVEYKNNAQELKVNTHHVLHVYIVRAI